MSGGLLIDFEVKLEATNQFSELPLLFVIRFTVKLSYTSHALSLSISLCWPTALAKYILKIIPHCIHARRIPVELYLPLGMRNLLLL